MRNQQKCSYGPSYVQLKFNFQILNVQNVCKFIKIVKQQTQNPRGNHFFESSKFAILDPQRVRVTFFHFVVNSGKHAKSLK